MQQRNRHTVLAQYACLLTLFLQFFSPLLSLPAIDITNLLAVLQIETDQAGAVKIFRLHIDGLYLIIFVGFIIVNSS